jgi:hypothetical protein
MHEAGLPVKRDCMNEIFTLLGCNAALIGSYRRFGSPMALSCSGQAVQEEVLEDVTDRLSRNVGNYPSTLSKIPEDEVLFTPRQKLEITECNKLVAHGTYVVKSHVKFEAFCDTT